MTLSEFIDNHNGEDHEGGDDAEEDLQPYLQLPANGDSPQAALLETGGAVLAVMVVMMMFCHYLKMVYNNVESEMRMDVPVNQRLVV